MKVMDIVFIVSLLVLLVVIVRYIDWSNKQIKTLTEELHKAQTKGVEHKNLYLYQNWVNDLRQNHYNEMFKFAQELLSKNEKLETELNKLRAQRHNYLE